MYVVKLKYKESHQACYANNLGIQPINEIRDEDSNFHLHHFFMSLKDSRELMFYYISKNNSKEKEWFDEDKNLEYISIVEISNYEPYKEWAVISFKEFK